MNKIDLVNELLDKYLNSRNSGERFLRGLSYVVLANKVLRKGNAYPYMEQRFCDNQGWGINGK